MNLLKQGKEGQVRKIFSKYMKESQSIFLIKNYQDIVDEEAKHEEERRSKCMGNIRFLYNHYKNEFWFGIILGGATANTSFNCFYAFLQLL